ncbi:MAG: glycosyltransferase family 4 protein [Solirubrobacteraceae bacterium]
MAPFKSKISRAARARAMWAVILVENDTYPQDVRVRNEAESLTTAGFRVTVVAPRGADQARRELIEGVDVVRFWLPTPGQSILGFLVEYLVGHLQLAWHGVRLLIRGADVLQVCNPPDTLAPLLILTRLFGRKAVFDNHDLFPELFALRYGNRVIAGFLRVFQRLAFRSADLVLTTNESQRLIVLQAARRAPESVVVVRNGPHEATIPYGFRNCDKPTDRAVFELVFVGAMEPQDGAETLAEILELLERRHGVSAHLTAIGAGSCQATLARACQRRGLAHRVSFTGRIPHCDVAARLAGADVCVDPAPCNPLNDASTMMKIAEYMAAGKPIVAFDLLETRRTAGGAALYASCNNVEEFTGLVASLAKDRALAQELTRAARERVPTLVWERSAERLLAGYAQLTG